MNTPTPICLKCKHFQTLWTCSAFPEQIPDPILDAKNDHRRPYPGDHGIQYEPITEMQEQRRDA